MSIEKYKRKFAKKHLFDLEELSKEEVDMIPKYSKDQEYKYLKKKGYISKGNKYYRKVAKEISDTEMQLFSQLKSMELMLKIEEEISNMRKETQEIHRNLKVVKGLLIFGAIVLVYLLIQYWNS